MDSLKQKMWDFHRKNPHVMQLVEVHIREYTKDASTIQLTQSLNASDGTRTSRRNEDFKLTTTIGLLRKMLSTSTLSTMDFQNQADQRRMI